MSSAYADTLPSSWVAVWRNSISNDSGRSVDPPALTSLTMTRAYRGSGSPARHRVGGLCAPPRSGAQIREGGRRHRHARGATVVTYRNCPEQRNIHGRPHIDPPSDVPLHVV